MRVILTMVDLTDIKGIGPSKAETLEESGFETVESIAEAEQDALAEVDGVGDDRALEFIVQAQNVLEEANDDDSEEEDPELEEDEFDLQPKDVADELEDLEDEESDEEQDSDEELGEEVDELEEELDEEQESDEEDGPTLYTINIEFDEMLEYDVFHAALMRRHEAVYTSNQPSADALQQLLDGLDNFEEVEYELTEYELNELHSAVLQQRTDYQGDNLIEHMDALKKVELQVNGQRDELLF